MSSLKTKKFNADDAPVNGFWLRTAHFIEQPVDITVIHLQAGIKRKDVKTQLHMQIVRK